MECNQEEAVRVTVIAEQKFAKKDLVGAKRFILKALKLYPCLDDAIHLSAVLDVYIAAQVGVGINEPEPDYYGILQVEPLSDASAIKKQYRNLFKLVHPNKSKESMKEKSGAAFKLIAKAFEVLSDEETRFQHDLKRSEKPTAKEPSKPTHSTQPQQQDVKRGSASKVNPQLQPEPLKATYFANQPQHQAAAQPTPAAGTQASQAPNTFWTACPVCRMQYQYNRIYLDNQVVCQKCHSSFPANDVNVHPANGASAFTWPPSSPAPGAQASQAPYTFSAQPTPAPGAQASQAPNTNGTSWDDLRPYFGGVNPFGDYGASTNDTSSNNLPPSFSGANSFGDYGASTNGTSWDDLSPYFGGVNPLGDYSASTNGTSPNNLPPFFNGANPFGDYGASTNATSSDNLLPMLGGGNPFGDSGNSSSTTQLCLSMLMSAMNLS